MKATDLRVGMIVTIKWGRMPHRIDYIDGGRTPQHILTRLDIHTLQPLLSTDGTEVTTRCSSRDIQETWEEFLRARPDFLEQQKAQQQEKETRAQIEEIHKATVEECSTIMESLGVSNRVIYDSSWLSRGTQPYQLTISDQIPELTEILRDALKRKWASAWQ